MGSFAAILGDGSVFTWGDHWTGGKSGVVQDQLKYVQCIQALMELLPPSWAMGLSSRGVAHIMVATVVLSRTS